MMIGYARVSTLDQHLDLQLDALNKQGCEKIYQEQLSASLEERPQLQEMIAHLRRGVLSTSKQPYLCITGIRTAYQNNIYT